MTGVDITKLITEIRGIAGLALSEEDRSELRARKDMLDPTNSEMSKRQRPSWARVRSAVIVDLLQSDARLDSDPVRPISLALKTNPPGTVNLVKHKWEPQPLYDVWEKSGVDYFAEQQGENEWWIFIRKNDLR